MAKLHKLRTLIPMEEIEQAAQTQIYDVLNLDFLIKLAIMPDCHLGYDLPIGGIALLDGIISPSFVGYDQGCGVCLLDTGVKTIDVIKSEEDKERIFNDIYKRIPTGFSSHSKKKDYTEFKSDFINKEFTNRINEKIVTQLGTLGGGNHFSEVGTSKNSDNLCITIHSGSRNVGHTIASVYMKQDRFLSIDSEIGKAYIKDLEFALQFALANRLAMMKEILNILGINQHPNKLLASVINENHNHAVVNADGSVLHRKGATPADLGQLGVIPANMRDGVYVTRGLGNQEYLSSASHGAGRVMGRNQAKKNLSMDVFTEEMRGIKALVNKSTLDESPDAYKNIDLVLKYQNGIVVDVIDHITPIISIKSGEENG